MNSKHIAFIGAGNMATSLIGGLIDDGYDPNLISASRRTQQKLDHLAQRFQVHVSTDNLELIGDADVVVLAVKPQILKSVAQEVAGLVQSRKPLVLSIAAGVRAKLIDEWLGGGLAIVRCMPNTAAMVRSAATALYANDHVTDDQKATAESIMRAVGVTIWVDEEDKLDVVTALSGSGPAYFFLMIEALQSAAEKLGLSKEEAHLLTLQTSLGATRLGLESAEDVAILRENVTSPGGTTEAALDVLEKGELRELYYKALSAATERAKALSEHISKV